MLSKQRERESNKKQALIKLEHIELLDSGDAQARLDEFLQTHTSRDPEYKVEDEFWKNQLRKLQLTTDFSWSGRGGIMQKSLKEKAECFIEYQTLKET